MYQPHIKHALHSCYYYYVLFSANEVERCDHRTQELTIYMNRQDKLVFEYIGCYRAKRDSHNSVGIGDWCLWEVSVEGTNRKLS